ncbi:MAG: sigma-70 family RNA polymerase sigma factor [Pseudobdellovibrionaceae bacterium]|nr:sigma-70 family RNA polymerase sigma factor [Pseudobdellovibrionaceae bacterium]
MPRSGVDKELDVSSLEALYKKHAVLVYRRCYRLLGNPLRAEEAMQEVFLKLLKPGFDIGKHPKPVALLFRIATHICLNLIRSDRRRPETLDGDLLLEIVDNRSLNADPTDRLFAESLLDRELSSTQLMAIYHFVDGMTLEELAREFKLSVNGIRKRLQKFKISARAKGEDHRKS